ncbi:hypothetical protein RM844_09185 [Streptomyces sp. DSM 44915]|uniref:Uncharacterized protein n=1 Tax=Streptomyces chisholmiae TaxID=3075540 RepID=A0ABU2JN95_9ACTN|nr:hypothetical protein [Streptomyces sp. DSM 44915]MDT0266470.1 hypothetical protein [Streptomyces sp. DSM 44915]
MPATPDPAAGGPYPAVCGFSHLFRGARVRVQGLPDPAGYVAAPAPVSLELLFSDGVTLLAEVLVDAGGAALLAVPAYTTEAGAAIAERRWPVREFAVVGEPVADVELTLDGRLD